MGCIHAPMVAESRSLVSVCQISQGPADHGMFDNLEYLLPSNYAAAVHRDLLKAIKVDWQKTSLDRLRGDNVYAAFYRVPNFKAMVKPLRLGHDSVRLHYQGVTRLPLTASTTLLLVDEVPCQQSSVIPPEMRATPPEGMEVVIGGRGEHCSDVCRKSGNHACLSWLASVESPANTYSISFPLRMCKDGYFDFLNSPEIMEEYFGCERGFGLEIGQDLPAYVVGPEEEHYQACVINFGSSRCSGRHQATARLCPCFPQS
eukprot:scaffold14017_cov36-Prasinocladus_malaysianus.AAC.1